MRWHLPVSAAPADGDESGRDFCEVCFAERLPEAAVACVKVGEGGGDGEWWTLERRAERHDSGDEGCWVRVGLGVRV